VAGSCHAKRFRRVLSPLSAGAATITIPNPLPGQHTVFAQYSGDARNKPSSSASQNFRAGPPEVSRSYFLGCSDPHFTMENVMRPFLLP
jgi:hypothetical protein